MKVLKRTSICFKVTTDLSPGIMSRLLNLLLIGLKLFICNCNITDQALNSDYKILKVHILIDISLFSILFLPGPYHRSYQMYFQNFWNPLRSHLNLNILTVNWLLTPMEIFQMECE